MRGKITERSATNQSGQVLNTWRTIICKAVQSNSLTLLLALFTFRLELQVHDVQTARILRVVEQHKKIELEIKILKILKKSEHNEKLNNIFSAFIAPRVERS